jgi:predicted outer membrane protein
MKTCIKTIAMLTVVSTSLMLGCTSKNSADGQDTTSNMEANDPAKTTMNEENKTDFSDWPARPRLAIQEMMSKYGDPVETSSEAVIWHNEGPYKRIMVTKQEIPHDFPMPHMDFLEHTVSYNVPTDKVDDLVAFDASMTVNKTAGEMSARCDLEGHNVLTLNIARDIINGTRSVEQARTFFGQNVADDFGGKHPAYVEKLQFTPPTENVLFPDKPVMPGSAMREVAGTEGTDAEIISFINAVNLNEILAASTAQKKKIDAPVMDYAKMLHKEHGANMAKTMQLGLSIKVTPSDTKEVDELKKKGAAELAMLVPKDGKEFESAYVDAMIKGHTEAITMIDDKLLKQAKNEVLKTHLRETKQHITVHLDQAKKLKGNN